MYKYREVYTVIRPVGKYSSKEKAREDFLCVQDEAEEYLYGSVNSEEEIAVKLQVYIPTVGHWFDVE